MKRAVVICGILFLWMGHCLFAQDDAMPVDLYFSHERGFYQENFELVIRTQPEGRQIRYTVDGSDPALSSTALEDASPLSLTIDPADDSNRDLAPGYCVRAVVVEGGEPVSPNVTHTYLFVKRVVELSPDGDEPGPDWLESNDDSHWGQVINYGMDRQVTGVSSYRDIIDDALLDVPSMSLVLDLFHLFDSETGIYVNAAEHGVEWERPCSLELIHPDDSEGFQINAGLRIRGGWSRNESNPKRAFRFFFRSDYGESKLHYPLFDDEGVDEFDKIDLRTSMNYSWSYQGSELNTMNRDVFSRDLQHDMGQPYTRSRYYHLYINGTYWGLYQSQERSEKAYGASYLGGSKEAYDVIKVDAGYGGRPYEIEATDGNLNAWRRLWDASMDGFADNAAYYRVQGRNPDGTINTDYEKLVDVDHIIDYMLNVFVAGDYDSPVSNFSENQNPNNWYGVFNRENPDGFYFFRHDAEHTMRDHEWGIDRTGPFPAGSRFEKSNPQWIFQQLTENALFRARIADRVQLHFFNGGALTPEANIKRFLNRADEIDLAIVAESARWGDSKSSRPFTRDQHWQPAIDWIADDFFPERTGIVLNQLIAKGWYPTVAPPVFNSESGRVPQGFNLSMSASQGLIYYTTDGSDPCIPKGGDASVVTVFGRNVEKKVLIPTSNIGTNWRSKLDYNTSDWLITSGNIGYERNQGYENLIDLDVGPQMIEKQASCYTRVLFDLTQEQIDAITSLSLEMFYDDGFAVFLNGILVSERNKPDQLTWNAQATQNHEAEAWERFTIDKIDLLKEGRNLLAVQTLNVNLTSSDFMLGLALSGHQSSSQGTVASGALAYDAPLTIEENTVIRARVQLDDQWSASKTVHLFVPTDDENLKLTEIHYHPLDRDTLDNDGNYEFIELKNIGSTPMDLSGWQFANGIQYTFPTGIEISAGAHIVLASNHDAFVERYHQIPQGVYSGQLDNSGERLVLLNARLDTVIQLRYNDKYPWPRSADGEGFSLNARMPDPYLDPGRADYWTASSEIHGNPGQDIVSDSSHLDAALKPDQFVLHQGYPNPFNPSITLSFCLHIKSPVIFCIYNVLGKEVARLIDKEMLPGFYSVQWHPESLAGGVYIARMMIDGQVQSVKMLYVK